MRVCPSCKDTVEPVPPKSAWKVATVLFWIAAMVTAVGFSLLLGLNVVLVPAWLLIGMSVGVAARRASEWTCPTCAYELAPAPRVVEEHEEQEQPRGGLVPRPA